MRPTACKQWHGWNPRRPLSTGLRRYGVRSPTPIRAGTSAFAICLPSFKKGVVNPLYKKRTLIHNKRLILWAPVDLTFFHPYTFHSGEATLPLFSSAPQGLDGHKRSWPQKGGIKAVRQQTPAAFEAAPAPPSVRHATCLAALRKWSKLCPSTPKNLYVTKSSACSSMRRRKCAPQP